MSGKSTCNWCSSTLMDPKNNTIHVIYFVLLSSNSKKAVEYKATKKQTQARSLQSWQKRFILVQITFNWSYSIGVIHGTVIVHSDCYSLCATGLHVRSLAVMFINDLPSHVNTQVDIFADDTTLLAPSDFAHVEDLVNTLSWEVLNVDELATINKLPLNCSKTLFSLHT